MVQTRVTCDASTGGKTKAGKVTGAFHHLARDVDARHGIFRSHSNKSIDPSRSISNVTLIPNDGPRDTWKRADSMEELRDRLEDRLAVVTSPRRKDRVVMRGIVVGLSPEWVEANVPNWKTNVTHREKFMETLDPVVSRVIEKCGGAKNVVLVSGHFDEAVPQIQIAMTPVTDEGRLKQNAFDMFKSPGSMHKVHKEIREDLKRSGIDVIMESSERSKEHLSNVEYARKAEKEREEKRKEFEAERKRFEAERQQIAAERKQLDEDKALVRRMKNRAVDDGKLEGYREGFEEGQGEAAALIAEVEQQRQEVEAERQEVEDEKTKLPKWKRAAAKKGYEEGKEQAGTLIANARQKANDIVAEAHAGLEALRKQREDEETRLQETSDAVTAKHEELQRLRQEAEAAEAVKNSRESMKQLDSDFLDWLLENPKMQEHYERFKKKRVKGFAAVVDGTADYYERTVGENQQRQEQRTRSRQRQQNQQQYPTQPGYTPMYQPDI